MLSRRWALAGLVALTAVACSTGGSAQPPQARPTPPATRPTKPPQIDPAARTVAAMSLEQQIGQLLLPQVYGSSATDVTPAQRTANQALLGVGTPAEAVARYHLAGVTLLERNTTDPQFDGLPTGNADDPKQLRRLTDGLRAAATAAGDPLPLLIGLDQEGGTVIRLRSPATEMPAAQAVGATGDPELARQAGAATAAELRAVGVTVELAPVADIGSLPTNTVIATRSYGADPARVAAFVSAAVGGLQGGGVAATIKHFPGHGGTDVDSHDNLPTLPQSAAQLAANDLVPFRAGIGSGADLVMAGHLRVPAYDADLPASLSPKLIDGLLRGRLGYRGVVITDGMGQGPIRQRFGPGEAAIRAVHAGDDLISLSANTAQAYDALLAAVRGGTIPRATVVAAATRVVRLRMKLAAPSADIGQVGSPDHQALAARIAAASITRLGCGRTPLPPSVTVTGLPGDAAALATALAARGIRTGAGPPVVVIGSGSTGLAAQPAVATVSVGTPYALAASTAPVRLAAYSDVPASIDALAEVLVGRGRAAGQLPVPVDGLQACPS